MKRFEGIGVSRGIAIGKAFLYLPQELPKISQSKDNIKIEQKKKTIDKALEKTRREISSIHKKLIADNKRKEADIFEAHLLFLDDPSIKEKINTLLQQGYSATYAVESAFEESAKEIEKIENEYLKERANDLRDVKERIIRNILNIPNPSLSLVERECIIVAKDLTPSDTANLDTKKILGLVTERGSSTSHTAILAEALGIPAVVGIPRITESVNNNTTLIVDGENGIVVADPDKPTIKIFIEKKEKEEKKKVELEKIKFMKLKTKSGKEIEILANIGNPEDAETALKNGADGIGLYRTEFLFLGRENPPSEEEQFEAYRKVLEKFKDKPVIIRTLDIGGDKQIPYLNIEKELNPFLGVRAIRLCLKNTELFKTQLRAILRASIYGNPKIMYPMIAIKEEIEKANSILEEVKSELKSKGVPFKENIQVGIMVEIPSAALNAEKLAKYVDFFSIGTNDLIQYTFAADRTNEKVSYLYNPLHPALLKLVKFTIEASHKYGKKTGMCGEMAGDLKAIPQLIKMGIDELSMTPTKIPYAKKFIKDNF